ncbi:hypothetical protein [Carp edema virus]|nr:hypothetical protein [Carp edema virus]
MQLVHFLTLSTLLTFSNSLDISNSKVEMSDVPSMNVTSFMGMLLLPLPDKARVLYLRPNEDPNDTIVIWDSSKSWLKSCTLQMGKSLLVLRYAYEDSFYYDNYEKIQFRVSSENGYLKYPIRSFDCSKEKAVGLGVGISVTVLSFIVLCFLRRICCR